VAEWFKAPILKFWNGHLALYRNGLLSAENIGEFPSSALRSSSLIRRRPNELGSKSGSNRPLPTIRGRRMTNLSELELLGACRIALRQLDYDGDDKTAFHGAAWDALTKAIARAEGAEKTSAS
jgi:hypothetical protein